MAQEFKNTPVSTRPTKDFKALPELGRPGGTKEGQAGSTDIQFFQETATKAQWIGKCGLSAMTKPAVLLRTQKRYDAQYKRARYFDEYREAVALSLYQTLGVTIPEVAVSMQLPAKVSAAVEKSLGDMLAYRTPCLHLMTKFVIGFQVLGKPFITAYQQQADFSKPTTVTTPSGETLPLKGLGAALAVGCFLHDADCLGGGGANMGYVVQTDPHGQRYAQLVKIDAGAAFAFLEGDSDIYAHDPRKRNMFFGLQKEFILRYDQLNLADQTEFAQAAKYILQVPQSVFKTVIDQGIAADGFTQPQADRIVNELVARKAMFLNGFAPEVSSQLKAEVKMARDTVLAELLAKPGTPSAASKDTALDSKDSAPNNSGVNSVNPLPDAKQDKMPISISSSSSTTTSGPVLGESESVAETKQGRVPVNSPSPFSTSSSSSSSQLSSLLPSSNVMPRLLGSAVESKRITVPTVSSPENKLGTSRRINPLLAWGDHREELPADIKQKSNVPKSSLSVSVNSSSPEAGLLAQQAAAESNTIRLTAHLEKERIKGEKPDEKAGCRVFQKPAVSAYFTGREAVLANVAKQLHSGHGSVITQGISGLGGVGKTQIAARYAQLASEGATCGEQRLQYQAVIWLNAEYNLDIQFLMLAEAWLNQTGLKPEEAVGVVYRYLQDKHTLLVFDNAVDKESIAPFLPPSKPSSLRPKTLSAASNLHVLITSRNTDWQDTPTLSVSGFSIEEATAFVRQRLAAAIPAQTATAEQINALLETVSTFAQYKTTHNNSPYTS